MSLKKVWTNHAQKEAEDVPQTDRGNSATSRGLVSKDESDDPWQVLNYRCVKKQKKKNPHYVDKFHLNEMQIQI